MNSTIPGIPTLYKHRQYRSRLEARWAHMFDLLNWRYEYEPYDLNGWIPDFALYDGGDEILVEVKPYSRLRDFSDVIEQISRAVNGTAKKANEILLLGSTIPIQIREDDCIRYDDDFYIGWLSENGWFSEDELRHGGALSIRSFAPAHMTGAEDNYGFGHGCGNWLSRFDCAPTGCECHPNKWQLNCGGARIVELWARAANEVQCKTP